MLKTTPLGTIYMRNLLHSPCVKRWGSFGRAKQGPAAVGKRSKALQHFRPPPMGTWFRVGQSGCWRSLPLLRELRWFLEVSISLSKDCIAQPGSHTQRCMGIQALNIGWSNAQDNMTVSNLWRKHELTDVHENCEVGNYMPRNSRHSCVDHRSVVTKL